MKLLRNLREAARPLEDERPQEPLVHRRAIRSDEQCILSMDCSSWHPVAVRQPLQWDDAAEMIDRLHRDGITVFHTDYLPRQLCGRMLDFLCGAALIHRAGLYRIAEDTYLLTPQGVRVDQVLLRELENLGLYTQDSRIRHLRLA